MSFEPSFLGPPDRRPLIPPIPSADHNDPPGSPTGRVFVDGFGWISGAKTPKWLSLICLRLVSAKRWKNHHESVTTVKAKAARSYCMRTGRCMRSCFFSHMVAIMIEGPAQCRFDEIVHKWLAFVEKRRDYLVELHMSGQWSDHFEEQKFKRYVREAADAVERWAAVVPPPRTETKPRPATTLPTPGRRGIA
ncbi:MAG TPA: hypothetical protein VK148_06585 [Xanthobacteraceae bacterium]|nr:hypothetical protein [Xanthobacteraceae bacterium]